MDLLSQCAQEFQKLLPYEYRFTIGRKGKLVTFSITFEETDFHHLAGLHKLRDNALFITGARNRICRSVLAGHLKQADTICLNFQDRCIKILTKAKETERLQNGGVCCG